MCRYIVVSLMLFLIASFSCVAEESKKETVNSSGKSQLLQQESLIEALPLVLISGTQPSLPDGSRNDSELRVGIAIEWEL